MFFCVLRKRERFLVEETQTVLSITMFFTGLLARERLAVAEDGEIVWREDLLCDFLQEVGSE